MKIILLVGSLLLSSVSLAQIGLRDCDQIQIGNTGMSYNIEDISKAIRANNDQQLKVVEVDIYPAKIRDYSEDTKQLFKSAVLIGNSKDHLAPDKYKHVVGGAIISYGTKEVARLYFKDDLNAELKSTIAGIVASTLTGILKEVRDSRGYGNVEAKDAIATSLGGALVAVRYNYKF
jgi:hypothetical protein